MSSIPPGQLLDLTGRVVVVTGGSRGIGRGIAERFAEAGAAVLIGALKARAEAEAVRDGIVARGGRAAVALADVSTEAGARAVMAEAQAALGGLDVLVNNAGTYPVTPLLEMSAADFDGVLAANLRSVFLCTRAFAQASAGGLRAVVNIASIEGTHPAFGHSHYSSAKAGVLMHTRASALELGPMGIRVNAVSPGLIDDEGLEALWPDGVARFRARAPLGRLGHRREVADACLFLASPAAGFITGTNLVVDGGVSATPAF